MLGLKLILTGAGFGYVSQGMGFFFQILILFQELEFQQVESGFVKTANPQNFSLLQAVCRCQKHGKVVKLFEK